MSEPIDVFKEVKALNFPVGEYIVVGSGIMAARGIRPAYDLDIVVTPKLFEQCRAEGWEVRPWTREGKIGKEWLKRGLVDILLEVNCGDANFSTEELLRDAEIIQDVPFISLERLVMFKKNYGRPRDFEDVALIEYYLKS